MYLSAYVRDKQTKQYHVLEHTEYETKKAFIIDLKANGYTVIRVSNKRDIKAQDRGYTTFAELRKYHHDEDYIKEVEAIEL